MTRSPARLVFSCFLLLPFLSFFCLSVFALLERLYEYELLLPSMKTAAPPAGFSKKKKYGVADPQNRSGLIRIGGKRNRVTKLFTTPYDGLFRI